MARPLGLSHLAIIGILVGQAWGGERADDAAQTVDLGRGLIAHYAFDKDASDSSGQGHHATNHGATPVAEGKLGGAFAFDGKDDHVRIPAKATEGLVRFTFALWVKTEQSEAQPREAFWQNVTLLGTATHGWGSRDLALLLENGRAAYFHGLHVGGRDMAWFSPKAVNDKAWHHVALVCEGPRVMLYGDGHLLKGEASAHGNGAVTPLGELAQTASGQGLGEAELFIGACHDPHSAPHAKFLFQGLLDDVRLWSRALSAKEVAALAAGVAAPTPSQ